MICAVVEFTDLQLISQFLKEYLCFRNKGHSVPVESGKTDEDLVRTSGCIASALVFFSPYIALFLSTGNDL